MGGVNLKDQLLHTYMVERKKMTKWYLRLFKRYLTLQFSVCLLFIDK